MSEKTNLSLTLAKDDVERIINETLKAQIAAQFASRGEDLFRAFAERLVNVTVDEEGRPSNSSYRTKNIIEFWVEKAIAQSVRAATERWVAENAKALEAEVEAALTRGRKKFASALVASFVEASKSKYAFKVDVTPKVDTDSKREY